MTEETEKILVRIEAPRDMNDNDIARVFGFADGFWTVVAGIREILRIRPELASSPGELADFFERKMADIVKAYVASLPSE